MIKILNFTSERIYKEFVNNNKKNKTKQKQKQKKTL